MKKIPLYLLLIFLFTASFPVTAGYYPPGDIQEIYSTPEYAEFYEAVYNAEAVGVIMGIHESLQAFIAASRFSSAAKVITACRASMILGKHFINEEYCKDLPRAEGILQGTLEALQQVPEQERGLEYRLVEGELYGSFFLLDQGKYLFSYGMKSNTVTNQAWDMDHEAIRSILLHVNQLIYTPPLFGGNVKKARELLLGIVGDELLPVDRYTVYSCLGMVEKRLRHAQEAEEYFTLALSIYPGNQYIRQVMAE